MLKFPPGVSAFDRGALEYDHWFNQNRAVYEAEIKAVKALLPQTGLQLEVGVGTGRFAIPFGIAIGVDPALHALRIALDRGISVCQAYGERLPFGKNQFNVVLLVTVDPFVLNFRLLLVEAYRVLKPESRIVLGVIDKDSALGRIYESQKEFDPFYRHARFHSADEIMSDLYQTGFESIQACQTLLGLPTSNTTPGKIHIGSSRDDLSIQTGYGVGAFVVFSGQKPKT